MQRVFIQNIYIASHLATNSEWLPQNKKISIIKHKSHIKAIKAINIKTKNLALNEASDMQSSYPISEMMGKAQVFNTFWKARKVEAC